MPKLPGHLPVLAKYAGTVLKNVQRIKDEQERERSAEMLSPLTKWAVEQDEVNRKTQAALLALNAEVSSQGDSGQSLVVPFMFSGS